MNVCSHSTPCTKCSSTKPAENVYFRPAKNGIYKVSVNYFGGPKGTGGTVSNFEVRIQTHSGSNVQTYKNIVQQSGEKRHLQVGEYEHNGKSLNFLEHVKKNYSSWSNTKPVNDNKWEIVLKKGWSQVASQMSQFYGYENNTPTEFQTLKYN
ncbi:unnamed protein product [Didymodactylos carnosus]|uniref:Uncharacterized protein n=1 Tax=Didymodactylos carnosus TaxID=1234261 RepID=A0A8S2XL38_9BILA|nr:unnamed protein product [Didymodactylos carnosus]